MLESMMQIFDSIALSDLGTMEEFLLNVVLCIVIGLLLGLLISLVYTKTSGSYVVSRSVALVIVLITMIFPNIVMLVGNNMARVFSLAGVMAMIRFRSINTESRDLGYILFAVAAGLGCGVGMYIPAIVFVLLISLVLVLLHKLRFGVSKARLLRINIPEDKDYAGLFDETFKKYAESFQMVRIRTTDLGALYELVYEVVLKDGVNEKAMIDDLRCLNGNLDIILIQNPELSYK